MTRVRKGVDVVRGLVAARESVDRLLYWIAEIEISEDIDSPSDPIPDRIRAEIGLGNFARDVGEMLEYLYRDTLPQHLSRSRTYSAGAYRAALSAWRMRIEYLVEHGTEYPEV